MASDNYEENRPIASEGARRAEGGGAETTDKAIDMKWSKLLGIISARYRERQEEKNGFTPEEIQQIKDEAHNILSQDDMMKGNREGTAFMRKRSLMLKEAVLSREIDEDDSNWPLLRILFDEPRKNYVDLAVGARDIMDVAGMTRDPRSQIKFSELLLGIHREFNKKIETLREKAKNPEEAARLAAAQSEDKMIENYLWKIPDPKLKLWNELFETRFAVNAGPEREFEKKMAQPKTAAEVNAELLRLKGKMEEVWNGTGGMKRETGPMSLEEGLPHIKKILSMQADRHDLELDAEYAREDPDQQTEELKKRYETGTINEDELEDGYTRIRRTMSQEKRKAMVRLAMQEARLYKDRIPLLDPEDEERRRLEIKLRICQKIAYVFSRLQ